MEINSEQVKIIHLLTFLLAKEEYGLPIGHVQEIINLPKITYIPQVSSHVEGAIHLRGNILPVYNLKKKLGLRDVARGEASKIVILEAGKKRIGILIDMILEVIHIPDSLVGPTPTLNSLKREFIKGVANLDNKLVILLDVPKLLGEK